MIVKDLSVLFTRDLQRLHREMELYAVEEAIWKTDQMITNSAGNLCLHLVGNLNSYIGKILGGTSYVRNREQEFSLKNIPRAQLLRMIQETVTVIQEALSTLNEDQLEQEYPSAELEEKTSIGFFLLHLLGHLNYHRGQVNYHRRMIDIPTTNNY
jgi:uncharacterized damage-inducible protein DinB